MSKILVVEDEETLAEAITFLLAKEGFEVEIAATGPAAVEAFDKNGADLILLDLMLPGLSGTEVCRQIRTKSSVPIIMLTAKDSEIDKVVGLELGADDYLVKPFAFSELLARVRTLLRRGRSNDHEAHAPTTLQLADLELDVLKRRASRAGPETSDRCYSPAQRRSPVPRAFRRAIRGRRAGPAPATERRRHKHRTEWCAGRRAPASATTTH